jgi:hypothetical protein
MEAIVVSTASREAVSVSLVKLTPVALERAPVVWVVVVAVNGATLPAAAHPRSTLDHVEASQLWNAACEFWRVSP